MLESLRTLGVDEEYLFGDLYGFSQSNHSKAPLRVDITETKGLGVELLKQKNYEGAIQRFSEFIRFDSMAWDTYFLRGFALAEIDQHEAAVEDYSTAASHADSLRETTEFAVLFNRANVHAAAGAMEEAVEDYSAAIELDSDQQSAYVNRGNAHFTMLDFEQAIEDYTNAPDSPIASLNKGIALLANECLDDAVEWYQDVLKKRTVRMQPVGPTINRNLLVLRRIREELSDVEYYMVVEEARFDDSIQLEFHIPQDVPAPSLRGPRGIKLLPGHGSIGPFGVEDGESKGTSPIVRISFEHTSDDEDFPFP